MSDFYFNLGVSLCIYLEKMKHLGRYHFSVMRRSIWLLYREMMIPIEILVQDCIQFFSFYKFIKVNIL